MNDRPDGFVEPPDDELSLQPLLQTLWRYRRTMLVALVAVVLCYVAVVFLMYARVPTERLGTLAFRLTFEGAAQDQYPNGTKFSSAEIVSTPVLMEVFKRNDLSRFGSFADFKTAVFVLQESPALEILSYEYQTKLADTKLSSVDRSRLEEEFRKKRDSLKSAEFSLNFRRRERLLQIPPTLIEKILQDTLSIWAEQAAQRKGAMRYDVAVLSQSALKREFATAEDYVVAADVLRAIVERVLHTAVDIAQIPGAGAVRLGQDQTTLSDIRANLEDVLRFKIEPLIGLIRSSGMSRKPSRMDHYFEGRLFQVRLAREEAEGRLKVKQQALSLYLKPGGPPTSTDGGGRGEAVTPQVSESFIDKLVALSTEANDVKYRQDMTDSIIREGEGVAELSRQASYYEAMRQAFSGARSGGDAGLEAEIVSKINQVYVEVGHVIDQVGSIYKLIGEQNLNPTAVLYTVTSPFVTRTMSSLTMRSIGFYFLVTMFLTLLVVPAAILAYDYFRHWISPPREGTRVPVGGQK
jgi:hypothetical protein